jgi:hypothetical protein
LEKTRAAFLGALIFEEKRRSVKAVSGTVVAKGKIVKIDKLDRDIGSGSETAVSENFGGGFLSLLQAAALSGERSCRGLCGRRA